MALHPQRQRLETLEEQEALNGDWAAPKSRRPSTRARMANAMLPNGPSGPKTSAKLSP